MKTLTQNFTIKITLDEEVENLSEDIIRLSLRTKLTDAIKKLNVSLVKGGKITPIDVDIN